MKDICATTAWIAVLSAGFAVILFLHVPEIHGSSRGVTVWTEAAQLPSPPAAAGTAGEAAAVKRQEPATPAGKTITTGARVIVIDRGAPVAFVVAQVEGLLSSSSDRIEARDAGAGSFDPAGMIS